MNLPGAFKFRPRNSLFTLTAKETENGGFEIQDINGERMYSTSIENVASWIGNGEWIIVDDKNGANPIGNYESIGTKIGQLVDKKNAQYGDAFNKSGDYLKILYPNGIQPHQYHDALALVRDFDKSMRIANGNQGEENAWNDKCGYAILMSEVDSNE